jgi:hypothetical protein
LTETSQAFIPTVLASYKHGHAKELKTVLKRMEDEYETLMTIQKLASKESNNKTHKRRAYNEDNASIASEDIIPELQARDIGDDSTCNSEDSDEDQHYDNTVEEERNNIVDMIPEMRIRGGAREEEKETHSIEGATDFILTALDDEEASPVGGQMEHPKLPGMIRISGFNPNGIKACQLESQLQHSKDLDIDIQCYSEVNVNVLRTDQRQKFHEGCKRIDKSSRSIWGTSQIPADSDYKPGGTAIISKGKIAGRVKKCGRDNLGRWTYQLLDGQGEKDILIVSIYQCCKQPTNPGKTTAYHQQIVLLSEMNRTDKDPRRNFYRDLKKFMESFLTNEESSVIPFIIGDWNEECKGSSSSKKLCDEFGLVNIFDRLYPEHKKFKTMMRGSRPIDFALAPPEIADRVSNFVYEPFMYRLKGDHRAFYFDIGEKILFGNTKESPYDPAGRSFSSKDPKAVVTYLKEAHEHLTSNNVFNRMKRLMEDNESNHEEAEKLDRELTRACEHGSNTCKRRRQDYWNIRIHELKRNLSIWCQFKRRKARNLPSLALIARTKELGLNIEQTMTPEEIEKNIKELRIAVKACHKQSNDRRDEMLGDLANFAEDVDEKKKANAIRQQKRTEKLVRAYRRLNFQRNKTMDGGGISRVQVPCSWPTMEDYNEDYDYSLEDPKGIDQKDNSKWKEVNCPKEIEFLLRLRNQRHFGQAETDGTPFTTEDMKHKFNWSASTNEAELVLKGEFDGDEVSEIARLMLDNMTRVTEVEDDVRFVTKKEFVGKFKSWRESTSTSPSGRHLGHYKSLVSTIDRSLEDGERTKYRAYQDEITECYLGLINYAIKHKYSLERWKTIVNMMIYKEQGNVKIHRLRVIHLYEADLGFLWGAKWGKAMRTAVKERTLHQGQYGGLPGRDCTSLTYLEELRFDYAALTRVSFANFDNDATACYDRILCSVASLAGRKYGIHKDIIFVHAQTLEEAEFKLKASNKVSETSYRHCIKFPIHGTGQGSTNSPTIWCFVSSVLFQSHDKKASGMLFKSPSGDMIVRFNMVGFVDDSTCITGGDAEDSLQQIIDKMKQDAQLWHDLLWCSGGKLELSKCGYHVIHYDFDASGIPKLRHSPGETIMLKNEHGEEIPIKAKNIFQTRKNLGHYKSPKGTSVTHFEHVKKVAVQRADAIVNCGGTRAESRLFVQSVWKPAVEYTLPQSFLSEKQLKSIETASMPKLYAACGYNRNTSRAVLAGPEELSGGGFTPLKVLAGSGYVLHFLKNWRTPSEDIGKTLRIVFAWTTYQAGITIPILEQTEINIDYIDGRVIPAMRKYLNEIGGSITLDNTMIRPKLRQNDESIMERAISMKLTQIQKRRINAVRMYLGIMYLSEICNTEGDSLISGIEDNTHDKDYYYTHLQKPKQNKPNTRSWNLWKKVILSFTTNNKKLKRHLGKWTLKHSNAGTWKSYRSQDNNQVYNLKKDGNNDKYWEKYTRHGTELRMIEDKIKLEDFAPEEGIPTQIRTFSNGICYGEMTATIVPDTETENIYRPGPMVSWELFLKTQPEWVQALLVDVHFYTTNDGRPDLYEILAHHDKHGHLLCVSDGSVIFHDMSFGWTLATPDGKRIVGSKGPCNGRGNSLRAEAAGMLSATMFLSILCKYLQVPVFNVVCISDNAELIRRCRAHLQYKEPFPNETLQSEYDVTEQIYRTQATHNIKATFYWVKGHQDKNKTYEELPLEAQLNIDADELAGEFQDEYGKFRPLVHLLPSCPAMLAIRGISITSNYRKQLIRAHVEPRYIQYLQYKFQWSNDTIEDISWKCLALAIRRINRNVVLTKVCNDLLPTSATLHKMRYQNHDTCILCKQRETRDHILRCQAPTRTKWRRQYIGAMQRKLDYLETDFALGETICTAVAEWLESGNVDISKYPIKYATAIISQENIGWRHFFGGKISQEWLKLQDESTNITTTKKPEGYIWGASLVETTLKKFIDLWELRNEEVHGKTIEQQESTRKQKLRTEVKKLNSMKNKARPSDMCLFHENEEEYIEQSTATMIATWVSSHRRAILNSVKKWALTAAKGSTSILQWAKVSNEPEVIERFHSRQRNKLINDGRKKERRRNISTESTASTVRQSSISSYYTLANH